VVTRSGTSPVFTALRNSRAKFAIRRGGVADAMRLAPRSTSHARADGSTSTLRTFRSSWTTPAACMRASSAPIARNAERNAARCGTFVLAHVGDSRIYRWRTGGELEQVTRDHSLLNHKIDNGELTTAEEISNFKQGNIIVRAVGLKDYVEPEVQTIPRRAGDVFLLCSDGLSDMVDDWSMQNVLEVNADDLQEASGCLVRMANDRGGKDNITVMLVRVDDAPAPVNDEVTDPGSATPFYVEDTKPSGIKAAETTLPVTPAVPASAHRNFDKDDDEPGFDGFAETTDPGLRDDEDEVDHEDRTDVDQPAFVGFDEDDIPVPRMAVEVRSGTARVSANTGERREVADPNASTRPVNRRKPSVIIEEPSIIVDDSLRKR
jgi:serine/threonine protein phosphatase PrpC